MRERGRLMAATIAVTLFDFDEVLCLFEREIMCAHLAQSSPLSADQVFEQVWTSGLDAQADRGEISGLHYVQAIGQRLGRELNLAQWVAARAAATIIIPGMLELAREVARQWAPRALKHTMDLGYEGDEHLLVKGEPLLLREALNNLIDNALSYAGAGSEVTLSVRQHGEQALLEVSDNGIGLSEADLPHVFERFWRASSVPGGCGLGLAIVKEITQRHSGSASVQAVTPHGLRVQLLLPLASANALQGTLAQLHSRELQAP